MTRILEDVIKEYVQITRELKRPERRMNWEMAESTYNLVAKKQKLFKELESLVDGY